ncbi:GatB/YqeY domain-containing protein [bacterium]|nr:GatB/YqeY domain-containing protein [bacterium]
MSLKERIESDFKKALSERDELRIAILRLLKASLKNREILLKMKGKTLDDNEVLQVINQEAKKRRESIIAFKKGNRLDLAEKEEKELAVLQEYLPEQLSDDKIKEVVRKKILETGALGQSDFGKVMKSVMKELKGRADGSKVSQIVKEELNK